MKGFTEGFKRAAVQKLLSRGNRTVASICKEMGVSTPSIYEWKKECGKTLDMKNVGKSSIDRSAKEKMRAVMEFERLPEKDQGEFLRREGLMSEHLIQWKNVWEKALDLHNSERPLKSAFLQVG